MDEEDFDDYGNDFDDDNRDGTKSWKLMEFFSPMLLL